MGLGYCKWYQSQTPGGVPARMLSPEERVSARTLGLKGGELWDPTLVGEGNETFFIRVWKPLPSRRVLITSLIVTNYSICITSVSSSFCETKDNYYKTATKCISSLYLHLQLLCSIHHYSLALEICFFILWIRSSSTTKPFQCQHCHTSSKSILFPVMKWTPPLNSSRRFVGEASRLH